MIVGGGALALTAWLVLDYIPLASLGIAGVLWGSIAWGLSLTVQRGSTEMSQMLWDAGMDK